MKIENRSVMLTMANATTLYNRWFQLRRVITKNARDSVTTGNEQCC